VSASFIAAGRERKSPPHEKGGLDISGGPERLDA